MNTLLTATNLSKLFHDTAGIRNINLEVNAGEIICFIGPSGGGKTTLLRTLAGLEIPDSGSIELHGRAAMVFQNVHLWPHKTVLEQIMLAPIQVLGASQEDAEKYALQLLEQFDLLEKKDSYPDFLSGGQQQRVAIVRALAIDPAILLLDEITSALDPALVQSVLETVRLLANNGQSIVMSTHNMEFAHQVADRIVRIENGCAKVVI